MKSKLDTDTTAKQKLSAFEDGLRKVLRFSKDDLAKAEQQYKAERKGETKRGPKRRQA